MGWSFNYVDRGRKAHIEELTSQKHFSPGYVPLEYRVVGNHVWQLIEHEGHKYICLDLIAKERNGGWGYKGISEDMGPCELDCPLPLLNKCTEPRNEWSAEWRKEVREFHAKKKSFKSRIKEGAVVRLGEYTYQLKDRLPHRRAWRVTQVESGWDFRMSARQLSRVEFV